MAANTFEATVHLLGGAEEKVAINAANVLYVYPEAGRGKIVLVGDKRLSSTESYEAVKSKFEMAAHG